MATPNARRTLVHTPACRFRDFKSAEIWDYGAKNAQGRCIITNQRMLLMSCEPGTTATITPNGAPAKGGTKGSVGLTYTARTSVWFHPIPVTNFRSIELLIETGSTSVGNHAT